MKATIQLAHAYRAPFDRSLIGSDSSSATPDLSQPYGMIFNLERCYAVDCRGQSIEGPIGIRKVIAYSPPSHEA